MTNKKTKGYVPNDQEGDVLQELSIGPDLTAEFQKQSVYYAHWAFVAAKAADQVRRLEEKTDRIFAQLYSEYREAYPESKENDCKSFIRKNPEYRTTQQRLRRAHYNADVFKAAVRAFEMRSSMLNQLGAQDRAEREQVDRGAPKQTKRKERDSDRASQTIRKKFQQRR